jgi:hypothetical protein
MLDDVAVGTGCVGTDVGAEAVGALVGAATVEALVGTAVSVGAVVRVAVALGAAVGGNGVAVSVGARVAMDAGVVGVGVDAGVAGEAQPAVNARISRQANCLVRVNRVRDEGTVNESFVRARRILPQGACVNYSATSRRLQAFGRLYAARTTN